MSSWRLYYHLWRKSLVNGKTLREYLHYSQVSFDKGAKSHWTSLQDILNHLPGQDQPLNYHICIVACISEACITLQDWRTNLRLQFSNDVSEGFFTELYNGSEIYKGELQAFRAVTDQAQVCSSMNTMHCQFRSTNLRQVWEQAHATSFLERILSNILENCLCLQDEPLTSLKYP